MLCKMKLRISFSQQKNQSYVIASAIFLENVDIFED